MQSRQTMRIRLALEEALQDFHSLLEQWVWPSFIHPYWWLPAQELLVLGEQAIALSGVRFSICI